MLLRIATFNVQGLLHQWVGSASLRGDDVQSLSGLDFGGPSIKSREDAETAALARRIADMDADVVCLQQVERAAALEAFLRKAPEDESLADVYPWSTVLEGNDRRLASLAVISRCRLGRSRASLTRYSTTSLPRPAGSRRGRSMRCCSRARRRSYLLLGTVGCSPTADELTPWANGSLELVDALRNATETRRFNGDPAPSGTRWTVREESGGGCVRYAAWDHIWAPKSLADHITAALIERRIDPEGDASAHDPASVTVDLKGGRADYLGDRRARPPHRSARWRRSKPIERRVRFCSMAPLQAH